MAHESAEFERLSLAQGLSHSTTYAIIQDKLGFLWFGTQNGLNRYDGHRFQVFQHHHENPRSLSQNSINSLVQDENGWLWIGTWGGGLNHFDPSTETFFHYKHDPNRANALSNNQVQCLFLDRSGILWIGTNKGGLNRYDSKVGRFTIYRQDPQNPYSLSHNRVWAVTEDRDGRLWVATSLGLNRLEPGRFLDQASFTHYLHRADQPDSLSNDKVRCLLVTRENVLWVGTERGLNRFDPDTDRFERFYHIPDDPNSLSNDTITSLYEDGNGDLWIGTIDGGLNRMTGYGRFASYRNHPEDFRSISQNDIRSIYEDRSGLLWIGTRTGGVNKLNLRPKNFITHKIGKDLKDNRVNRIWQDREGTLWIGSVGGLFTYDRETGRHKAWRHQPGHPLSLSDSRIYALAEDYRDFLWVGTFGGGINRMDPARISFTQFTHDPQDPHTLSADNIRIFHEDRMQRFWIGTWDGLNLYDRKKNIFHRYKHDPTNQHSLSDDRIIAIANQKDHHLWIGTFNGGLNRFSPDTGTVVRYRHDPSNPNGLSNDSVRAVYEDPRGRVWIGTYGGGLNLLEDTGLLPDQATFRRFTIKDGLSNDAIFGILNDRRGFLWISTDNGLSRFDPETMVFRNYSLHDGLQQHGFTQGASFRSDDGELFFGGNQGFVTFVPEKIEENEFIPPVRITGFQKFNRDVPLPKNISYMKSLELDYRDSVFSFEFATLDFANPSQNRYAYFMEGFDKTWSAPGTRPFVSYTNLDPGTYVLRVKGSNNDGVWNEKGPSILINIAPPIWMTWWAYTLYVVLTITLIVTWRKLKARRQERERLMIQTMQLHQEAEIRLLQSQMSPHFQHNVLSTAIHFIRHDPNKAVSILRYLSYIYRKTMASTHRVFTTISEEKSLIDNYLAIQKIRFDEELVFHMVSNDSLGSVLIPTFTVQPMVENAVVHGFNQNLGTLEIWLYFERIDDELQVSVENTGQPTISCLKDVLKKNHALEIINRRLEILFERGLEYAYTERKHRFSFRIPIRESSYPPETMEYTLPGSKARVKVS